MSTPAAPTHLGKVTNKELDVDKTRESRGVNRGVNTVLALSTKLSQVEQLRSKALSKRIFCKQALAAWARTHT